MTTAVAAPQPRETMGRTVTRRVLLTLATILTILGIVAVWANQQILNSNNWANSSTALLQNPQVRESTATYLVNQLYAKVDVQKELEGVLPGQLKLLAGPVSDGLRSGIETAVDKLLATPAVQDAWRTANRLADQAFIEIVNGGNRQVGVDNGVVTLNLGVILQDVAKDFGISLDLSSQLPQNIARIELFKSDQVATIQKIGRALKGLALLLSILAPLLFAVAVAVSPGRRRRTLEWVGAAGAIAGLVVILFRRIIVNEVPGAISKDATTKELIGIVTKVATSELVEVAGGVILIGVVIAICGWFAGPSRYTTPVRRWMAPYLRSEPLVAFGIVAAIMLLLFIWQPIPATTRPFTMIVMAVLALVGVEVLRRQTAQEFPLLAGSGSPNGPGSTAAEAPTQQGSIASEAPTERGSIASEAPTAQGDVAAQAPPVPPVDDES